MKLRGSNTNEPSIQSAVPETGTREENNRFRACFDNWLRRSSGAKRSKDLKPEGKKSLGTLTLGDFIRGEGTGEGEIEGEREHFPILEDVEPGFSRS